MRLSRKLVYTSSLVALVWVACTLAERQPGIVVPKRSSIISGLNEQFRHRNERSTRPPSDSSAIEDTYGIRGPTASLLSKVWLVGRRSTAAPAPVNQYQNQAQYQSLYLDRNQQQLLATNPALLEEPGNLTLALLTRATAEPNMGSDQSGQNVSSLMSSLQISQQGCYSADQAVQQQQLYRGFSLIELEVRSEQDRRYVRSLYGNLSAAIDEQAANPNAQTVSPYVDVDFWSMGLGLNERLDIMVSPRSRVFMLGQLARAKIRHRIKIDNIQARLDQLMVPMVGGASQAQPSPPATTQQAQTPPLAKSTDSLLSGRLSGSTSTIDASLPMSGREEPQTLTISSLPQNSSQFFENYQRLADINQFLEAMVERAPDIARVQVIGKSSQGRYLRVLKLGYEQPDVGGQRVRVDQPEPDDQLRSLNNASVILETFFRRQASTGKLGAIWIDGGTHAREWITPATALFIASRLVENNVKCSKFYNSLRGLVTQSSNQEIRFAKRYDSRPPVDTLTGTSFEPELLSGINEINSVLLGKPVHFGRARTNFEKTMELVAKSPRQVALESGCDLELEQILRRYTFFIEPVLNPDGYEYSHTHNRLWRKTRSVSTHPIYRHFCLGADPNRNYDARHGATGSSQHPCSQTFAGTVPFTEPETKHQSNFVYANRMNMKMYISLHSYSQMILLPYSHSRHLAPDHKDLETVAQAAVKAIEKTHGTQYKVGSSASILYTASGTAGDWAYEKAGIKYSYTMELRDTGNNGFLLPRQQIVPTGEETFNGLVAMIEQMEKNENLLSSKSGLLAQFHTASNLSLALPNYNRAPFSDNLKSEADQRPRATLENVLDGSDTWAAPDLGPSSVRDRRPMNDKKSDPLVDEVAETSEEPDSGYAFEGEGSLLEPNDLSQYEAGKRIDIRMFGRRDHSRRITQVATINSSGRSIINSPSMDSSRYTNKVRRRESSEKLPGII